MDDYSIPRTTSSTPVSPRVGNIRADENVFKKDKGLRRYASAVERVLASFETTVEEWADYISFLGRLLKALQTRPPGFDNIPYRSLVARRLAQCLNPTLPSGVHQKTLEVYAYIFESVGREGLSLDLRIYLPGLTPLLSFASLSVKPSVLDLFEKYIIVLEPSVLRPALKALILALLPALEEENNDEFERALSALASLKASTGWLDRRASQSEDSSSDQFFWQCLFLACITSASRRSGALVYLLRNLPRLGAARPSSTVYAQHSQDTEWRVTQSAIAAVASPEPGLLIRCFCAGLCDAQILIQRGFLDLLVTHLPLESDILQRRPVVGDLDRLVAAAVSVVTRKDMSLNRRLWSWFLGSQTSIEVSNGPGGSPTSPTSERMSSKLLDDHKLRALYFERYGFVPLVNSIRNMIYTSSQSPNEVSRPLRICLSLMDRAEIGELIVPQIFLAALQSVWQYQRSNAPAEHRADVLRSSNMLFDGVESGLIWTELFKLSSGALSSVTEPLQAVESLDLFLFVIKNFNVQEEEMQIRHMPLVVLSIVIQVIDKHQTRNKNQSGPVVSALKIVLQLLELIPPRALLDNVTAGQVVHNDKSTLPPVDTAELTTKIKQFYLVDHRGADTKQPLRASELGGILLQSACDMVASLLHSASLQSFAELDLAVSVLANIVQKGAQPAPRTEKLFFNLKQKSSGLSLADDAVQSFQVTAAKVAVLEALHSSPWSIEWIPSRMFRQIVPNLVNGFWLFLSPSQPTHTVEAVHFLWRLQRLCADDMLVESSLVTLMAASGDTTATSCVVSLDSARRFATLWTHTVMKTSVPPNPIHNQDESGPDNKIESAASPLRRPLIMLLEGLGESKSALGDFVVHWLQSLADLRPIITILLKLLSNIPFMQALLVEPPQYEVSPYHPEDAQLCLYYLQHLTNILRIPAINLERAIASSSMIIDQQPLRNVRDQLVDICLKLLKGPYPIPADDQGSHIRLKQAALELLQHLLTELKAEALASKELEIPFLEELTRSVEQAEHTVQVRLMDITLPVLRAGMSSQAQVQGSEHQRAPSRDTGSSASANRGFAAVPSLTQKLTSCLTLGLTSRKSRPVLASWVTFVGNCLPLYGHSIFQVLLPLVDCCCHAISESFLGLRGAFGDATNLESDSYDSAISLLLTCLERSLAVAHGCLTEETSHVSMTSFEQQQHGFFGNMVSALTSDANRAKTMAGNNRLTVLLCFKDAVKVCYMLWSWNDNRRTADPTTVASLNYTALRLRNRTRRMFEHLFRAEALECLETLVELWQAPGLEESEGSSTAMLDLLSVLDSARPKVAISAIFNAIYSRTNPGALDPERKSSLTSALSDVSLAAFLVAYSRSLDDDAMDEIWDDCVIFLRDVLTNPINHRQILAKLLEFAAVLGEKIDHTNFGEQRKTRRELADLFVRLLVATTTIRPLGLTVDTHSLATAERSPTMSAISRGSFESRASSGVEGLIPVLAAVTAQLPVILVEKDRIASTAVMISTQVLGPIFKAKAFPNNVSQQTLDVMIALARIPEASKIFKKEVAEAFNDPRFFSSSLSLVFTGWLRVVRQWLLADKERMPELLSRLGQPTVAGIMFGVGANAARLEADRRTQLNLRRIAFVTLASADDTYVVDLKDLQAKLVELCSASSTSSPSSKIRAEVYMVIRATVLKTSATHLAPLWPMVTSELVDALTSTNASSLLQACKLLDLLTTLDPDEFQLHKWLFVTDTADAVYRPSYLDRMGLVDELAQGPDAEADAQSNDDLYTLAPPESGRKPLLISATTKEVSKDELMDKVIRPFFRQLSIYSFENTYSMKAVERQACIDDLLSDLFDDSTLE